MFRMNLNPFFPQSPTNKAYSVFYDLIFPYISPAKSKFTQSCKLKLVSESKSLKSLNFFTGFNELLFLVDGNLLHAAFLYHTPS